MITHNQLVNKNQAKHAQINLKMKLILNLNKDKSHFKILGIH